MVSGLPENEIRQKKKRRKISFSHHNYLCLNVFQFAVLKFNCLIVMKCASISGFSSIFSEALTVSFWGFRAVQFFYFLFLFFTVVKRRRW